MSFYHSLLSLWNLVASLFVWMADLIVPSFVALVSLPPASVLKGLQLSSPVSILVWFKR